MVTGIETVSQPKQAGVITSTMATNSVITGGPVGSVESTVPPRRTNENRRSNKPIMEKRRRARINNCLNELKTLILDAMKKDPARHSKLEKADILEMTVKHLENLQRQQAAMTAAADPAVVNKFRAGFSECAGEVGRFPGLEPTVKRRLLQHLANCLAGTINNTAVSSTTGGNIINNKPTECSTTTTTQVTATPSVQVHILPSPATNTDGQIHLVQQNGIYFTNGNGTGVQLVPTRLPNGDIALVLPTQPTATIYRQQSVVQHSPSSNNNTASSTTSTSPLPLLIPIPSRTASTASAASSTSATSSGSSSSMTFNAPSSGRDSAPSPQPSQCYSVPGSPTHGCELMDIHPSPSYSPPLQKPLSLVIRKAPVEENPWWRPW